MFDKSVTQPFSITRSSELLVMEGALGGKTDYQLSVDVSISIIYQNYVCHLSPQPNHSSRLVGNQFRCSSCDSIGDDLIVPSN